MLLGQWYEDVLMVGVEAIDVPVLFFVGEV